MPFLRTFLTRRYVPWTALILAAAAGAALRYAAMDRLAPREFSYFIESCFRFRYAEMRMQGEEPPSLDRAAQWPEGFAADRMILAAPDRLAALFYKFHGGDTFSTSRTLINLLSALSAATFALLALAALRKPWPAAFATLVYAVTFGAYSRSFGNYLREDFAMPGLLLAAAATLYLLTAEAGGRRRGAVAAGGAAATLAAGSCWHMSQFYIALLGLFAVAYGLAGRPRRAALAGGALAVGLALAAVLNKPLGVKGALWNVSAAVTAAPAVAWGLASALKQRPRARWFLAGAAVLLVAASMTFGRSAGYGHVYELIWAKVVHLGRFPGPAALSPEARLFWVGPYQSPEALRIYFEYGPLALPLALGLTLWWTRLLRERSGSAGFVAAAGPLFAALYLLIARLTVFLAPWAAIFVAYPAAAIKRAKVRAAFLGATVLLLAVHVYTTTVKIHPAWYRETLNAITGFEPKIPWYYGSERINLLVRLAEDETPGAVLADFALSPPFLYLVHRPTVLNPMFEVPAVRRKALAYAAAAVADEETFYRQCRDWEVTYVVHMAPQVLSRGPGTFYNATAAEPEPGAAAYLMQFHPEKLRRFRLVYETYSARLFEVGRPYDGYTSPAYHPLYDPSFFAEIPSEEELKAFYREATRAAYYYDIACAQEVGGNYVAAAAAFSKTLRLHADFEDANLRLGLCNLELGRKEEARTALERAALLRPDDPRPRAYLEVLKGRRRAGR